jgi:CRISPR-associated protein Cmr3
MHIGGFDMQKREPKYMRKAVPAGSIYYFEKENDSVDISQIFNSHSICDDFADINYKNQGFGIYYFANI